MHLSLRLLLILVGVGGFALIAWQHWHDGDERPRALIMLGLLIATFGALEYRAQASEKQLSKAATAVARRDVSVRCQGLLGKMVDIGQELGTVQFNADGDPADVTHIKRDACNWAKDYAGGNRKVTREHAVAVEVISHEAIHLRGWPNEALTECYGMQHMTQVAMTLGASRTQGQRLADFYYRMLYPEMPDEYRAEDKCYNGGMWDLHKDSDIWPSP